MNLNDQLEKCEVFLEDVERAIVMMRTILEERTWTPAGIEDTIVTLQRIKSTIKNTPFEA